MCGPTIWNKLPQDLWSTYTKRSLTSWLFECAYGRRRLWQTQTEGAPYKWTYLLTYCDKVSHYANRFYRIYSFIHSSSDSTDAQNHRPDVDMTLVSLRSPSDARFSSHNSTNDCSAHTHTPVTITSNSFDYCNAAPSTSTHHHLHDIHSVSYYIQ